MKVKEVSRTACVAWSPRSCYPVYVASGTAANQLSASFDSDSCLELFDLGLGEPGYDMRVAGHVTLKDRLHSLVWADFPSADPKGLLIGGCDEGVVNIWSSSRVLSGEDGVLLHSLPKHTGAVRTLDINPFQHNLLVSGGCASEVYICDLNDPEKTMYPGAKEQPAEDIVCVRWNNQVQHILASVCAGGRAVIWDLRKQGPIIKVRDSNQVRLSSMAWHTAVPTQMVTASEDDRHPVIQMWDLRFANSPMKVLDQHKRGVLGVTWCPHDPDLLLSCAKDGRIICWDPNSQAQGGEIVCELPSSGEWTFDVQWCPRNPAVVVTSSFGSRVSVFSLMGGAPSETQSTAAQIEDSFLGTGQSFAAPVQPPPTANADAIESSQLKKAPKWVRPPVGARFAFGGKLVSFGHVAADSPKTVQVSQVVTDQKLVERSNLLEHTLTEGTYADFCRGKAEACSDERQRRLWNFLQGNFEEEPRRHFLQLLGYTTESLSQLVSSHTGSSISELASHIQQLSMNVPEQADDQSSQGATFQPEASTTASSAVADSFDVQTSDGTASPFDTISSADTGGSRSSPFAGDSQASAFDDLAASKPVNFDSPKKPGLFPVVSDDASRSGSPFVIQTDSSLDGVISQALLVGNFEAAVNLCIHADRMSDAILLAIAGGPTLLAYTQQLYLQRQKSQLSKLMSAVIQRDLSSLVARGQLTNWPQLLAALITYAPADEFASLCERLGQRLEEQGEQSLDEACLCYICSGSLERLIHCWTRQSPKAVGPDASLVLQDLIEKIVVLRQALDRDPQSKAAQVSVPALAEKLSAYAEMLASQGARMSAIRYLQQADETQEHVAVLMDRLYHSDVVPQGMAPPRAPFTPVSVLPERPVANTAYPSDAATQPAVGNVTGPGLTWSQPSYVAQPFPPGEVRQPQPFVGRQPQPLGPQQSANPYPSNVKASSSSQPAPGMAPYGSAVMQPPVSNPSAIPAPGQVPNQPRVFHPPNPGTGVQANNLGVSRGTAAVPSGITQYNPMEHTASAPQPARSTPMSVLRQKEGWNDPPVALMTAPPKSQPVNTFQPQPITAPLPMAPAENNPPSQLPHQPPSQTGPGANTAAQPVAPVAAKAPPPVAPLVKAPIPSEHQPMVQAFTDLLDRCQQAATNAMMRRKGEDVTKRLEVLKDHIREGAVAPPILSSLHSMSQAVMAKDYMTALQYHTQVVSSSNFSQISTYMTGLKTLLQLAQQLRI